MEPEMLQVQQYLNVHPILDKKVSVKEKYVVLITYFVNEQKSKDLWCKQALKLYCDRIVGDDFEIKKENTKDLSLFEQFKFFRYRYFLLTDCLFIACFDNKNKGQKILESLIAFYGERYRKKMECVYEAFYSTNDQLFMKIFPELKDVSLEKMFPNLYSSSNSPLWLGGAYSGRFLGGIDYKDLPNKKK